MGQTQDAFACSDRVREAALALALLLAGCSAFGFGPGGVTDTRTLSPVPEPGTPVPFPPGVTSSGVVDPETLATAHAATVREASFTLVLNRTVRWENGSVRERFGVRIRLARNRTYHVRLRTAGPEGPVLIGEPPASAEFWSDGAVYVRALGRENQTRTYNQFDPVDGVASPLFWTNRVAFGGQAGHPARTVRNLFGGVPTRVVGRVDGPDGPRIRLAGSTAESTGFLPVDDGSVRALRLQATVDRRGVVRRIDLRYRATVDGETVSVRRRVAYTDVGQTTVGRPEWIDRALDPE